MVRVGELAAIVNGRVIGAEGVEVTGFSVDSRTIKEGEAFFALKGENFDGHDFVGQAAGRGARAAVVSRILEPAPAISLICVQDVLEAFQRLAGWWRSQFPVTVVSVTGSSGKTTTKDMIGEALSSQVQVIKSEANFNNEVGVPMTLLGIRPGDQVAVLEVAMRGKGQIASLCQFIRPTIGVVTNIGPAHYELLGSLEAIESAKAELVEALPENGCAVLNADDERCRRIASRTRARVAFYGMSPEAEYRAQDVVVESSGRTYFRCLAGDLELDVSIPLPGYHNVRNALAALAVAGFLGLDLESAARSLSRAKITGMRLEFMDVRGMKVINDAYNANPDSMAASLSILGAVGSGRRVAILGDMLELGDYSREGHLSVGRKAAESGTDLLIALGPQAKDIAEGALEGGMNRKSVVWFASKEEARTELVSLLKPGDTVLVKASRGMRLEEVIDWLKR